MAAMEKGLSNHVLVSPIPQKMTFREADSDSAGFSLPENVQDSSPILRIGTRALAAL